MSEQQTIDPAGSPMTVDRLQAGLRDCGLAPGMTVLVHSSLSSIGWVCGGPVAVIEALLEVLGPRGTLLMPAHTPGNTDPARWQFPAVPASWWEDIRQGMPPFDPAKTPTRGMGVIAETFRAWPGVQRSAHPTGSFCAHGPRAPALLEGHALSSMFGDRSPLGRLHDLDGHVLLLGVDHDRNTSLHLAEHRARFESRTTLREGCAMWVEGERQWVWYDLLAYNADDFTAIGQAYEAHGPVTRGKLGAAPVRLMPQRPLVDFAVTWMENHRVTRSHEVEAGP